MYLLIYFKKVMSSTKSLIHFIEALDKKEFDQLVKLYLEKVYNYKSIIITDGKDDVGLDIRIFDLRAKKMQYQLTTQKSNTTAEKNSLKRKIIEDLEKAQLNHEAYSFENQLYFFYSYTLTNKVIRDFEKIALKEYGISLTILDANYLAQEIEDITDLKNFLYSSVNILVPKEDEEDVSKNSLLYDLISFGKPTEFKNQIINAYLYQIFLQYKELSFDEIRSLLDEKFKISENNTYYQKILNKFLSDRVLQKSKESEKYSLTEYILKDLKSKNDAYLLDKGLFNHYVENILKKYKQENYTEDYVKKLISIYTNNFESGLEEICSNKESYLFSDVYSDFSNFIENNLDKEKFDHKDLAIELLQLCKANKFIQKIAASNVYVSKISDKKLDSYLNNSKKIFIDTSIGLFSLCYWFKSSTKYENYYYSITRNLIEVIQKENIKIYISERYIWEIANHFKEAFKLVPFSKIMNNYKIGNSRNVFYNFYQHLKTKENYDESFLYFLQDFGLKETSDQDSFNSHITSFLDDLNIKKQIIPKEYPLIVLNDLFDNYLRKNYKTKTNFAKNCDSIMFSYLADNDIELHLLSPLFLTWDKSFYEVYKTYSKEYPSCQKWLNLSPDKYLDSNALLKFSINNEIFTDNILAFVSDDIITSTHSLIDSLSIIINPNDEVGREYTKKLADLRDQEIYQIANNEIVIPDNFEGEAILDEVVFLITEHYREKNLIQQFSNLFTKKEFMEDIVELIKICKTQMYESNKIEDNVYIEFNKLIEKTSL